jgi:hypothetical protein
LRPKLILTLAAIEALKAANGIHENVATKADIDRLAPRIDQVESGLKAEMRELELHLEGRIDRIVVRLGSVMVILAGIILAAIRYLPHS